MGKGGNLKVKILYLPLHDLLISASTPSLPNLAEPRLESIISWLIAFPSLTATLYLKAIYWPKNEILLSSKVLSKLKLNARFLRGAPSSSRSVILAGISFSFLSCSKIFSINFSLEMKLNFSAIFFTNSAVSFSSPVFIELISEWVLNKKSLSPKSLIFSSSSVWKKAF